MKNKILLLLAIISTCLSTNAQIKIDFDRDLNYTPTAEGYTQWIIGDVTSSSGSTSTKIKDTDITITLSWGDNTSAAQLTRNYWKDGLTKPYDKLVSDGIYFKDITSNSVAIDVEITGLPKGTHSIQAYHNNVDGNVGKILPPINVAVNDVDVLTDVEQTCRVLDRSESAKTYITFTVSSDTKATKIKYYTNPKSGVDYASKAFYINALEIGNIVNANNQAQNPSPANLDYHVDANGGVELSWTAAEGATSHIVYLGENEESVENGTCEVINTNSNSITKSGLSPLKRYYWRVDEVINRTTYKGEVWSFQPRRDAFPGAEGYGRYAIGGRGWNGNGKVYHVTSLKDDGSEGTFRYGIENATVPTTIVFDVSGVIHLQSRLTNSNPYVTIAGQTAPGNGIMFRGAPFGMATDGITRFMRLRRGDIVIDGNTMTITLEKEDEDGNKVKYNKEVPADCGKGLDGMGMAGNNHSIIDHCSIGWTVDEAFSSRNAKNITLQHTLISEALNIAGHPNYDAGTGHGYAATVGGDKGSLHHNLLAHNAGRNWSMGGGLDGAGYYKDYLDMFNNVCYNWVNRTTDGGVHVGKFVNNYYKMGPSSKKMPLIIAHLQTGAGTQEYYVEGNIRDNNDGTLLEQGDVLYPKGENEGDNSKYAGENYIYTLRNDKNDGRSVFYDSSWIENFDPWASVETANAAFKNVLSDVGCNYAGLDNHDVRMVSETLNGTTSTTGSKGKLAGIIDATTDNGCEGFDGLNIKTANRPANWDADGDGIPAWFETAMGWSDAAANNNADRDNDYYTDLEEYLNWMAVPHFYNMANDGTVTALKTGTNYTITLADYFAGYTSPTYTVVSDGGATASISNGELTYNFPASSSKLATIQVKATQDGISLTRSFNFFIDASDVEEPEEPTVTPEGTPYTLSTETYKSSTNTTTWNFTPDDLTFTVTNSNNKGYSAGKEYGVKYTAGVQYTIGIPTGIQVDYITFRGYDNYPDTDAYLGELNGTKYNATDYVFPREDSEGKYTIEEHTIQLANPAKGTLTFTPAGNQVVWVITLYTSEIKIELEDKKNTMKEVGDGTETVKETGTIKWEFDEGKGNKIAEYSAGIADYIKSAKVTLGAQLDYYSETKKVNGVTETLVQPNVRNDNPDETNTITFSVEAIDGATFTPTNVKFYISRIGTNNGYYDAKIGNKGGYSTIATKERPNRNNTDGGYYTIKDFDISGLSASQINSLIFNIYGLAEDKQVGLANIIITGTLEYQSPKTKTVVTLDEMATVHDLRAEDNVTVKMKRGLTAGAWNTFCVPFSVSKAEMEKALGGSEVEIVEYTEQEGTTLYFEDTDNIVAGKPYLIKPASFSSKYSDDMTPITFEGVGLEAANVKSNSREVASEVCPGVADYSFVGTYVRYIMETDGTELGLNSKNKLAKPAASTNIMRGLRGFFRYNAGNGAGAKVVINGTLTSIDEIDSGTAGAKGVYHVSGRYVRSEWNNGSGLPRGLYIVNGQKMVK